MRATPQTTLLSILLLIIMMPASLQAEVIQVDNDALQQLIDQGIPVIDVRTASEWQQTGVIEGSHLLTFLMTQVTMTLKLGWSNLLKLSNQNNLLRLFVP